MTRPRRILVGTFDTGVLNDFADGFRALGHHVTTVAYRPARFLGEISYDVDIGPSAPALIRWPAWVAQSRSIFVRVPRGALNRVARGAQLASLIRRHDIFFFQCGGVSLTLGNHEYWLLKRLRKDIIAAFLGGEARNIHAYRLQYGPDSTTPELEGDCERRTGHDPFTQLWAVRMAELYADVVLSQPNQSSLAVRRYSHLFIPLVVGRYEHRIPARDAPVVVHAPSSRATKGTAVVLATVDRLKREGVAFEFKLLENVPNHIVTKELVNADVLVDQLFFHYHGKLTLEALASGCAVASSNNEFHEPFPKGRPIWHIDEQSAYNQLSVLLRSKDLRLSLAVAGRKYVETYHDYVAVAKRILERLDLKNDEGCEHAPRFYAASYPGQQNRPIPKRLRSLTAAVLSRYGIAPGIDPAGMVERGLMLPFSKGLPPRIWPSQRSDTGAQPSHLSRLDN